MSLEIDRVIASKRTSELFIIAFCGIFFGGFVAVAMYMGGRIAFAFVAGVLAISAVLMAPNREGLLLALLTLSIPMNIGKTIGLHAHLGGAPGLRFSATDFAVICLYGLWLYDAVFLRQSKLELPKGLTWPALAVIATSMLSTFIGVEPKLGLYEVVRLLQMFALMVYVAGRIRRERQVKVILWSFLVAICIQGAIGLLQYKSEQPIGLMFFGESRSLVDMRLPGNLVLRRVGGTLGGDNILGAWLAMVMPLCVSCAILLKDPVLRLASTLSFVAGTGALLLTLSRGSWVGFAFAMMLTVGTLLWRKLLSRNALFFLGVCLLIFAAVLFPLWGNVKNRIVLGSPVARVTRIAAIKTSAHMFASHPFLGVGTNNFHEVMRDDYDKSGIMRSFGFNPVHNIYLLYLVDTGILGFAAFMWFLIAVTKQCVEAILNSGEGLRRAIAIGIFCGIVAHLVHGMVDLVFTFLPIKSTFWLLAGLAAALNHWPKEDDMKEKVAKAAI